MISHTTDSHGTEPFQWLYRVLKFLGDSKKRGEKCFDFPAAASDPANNVTLNLKRCSILCRAAPFINISEGGSENDEIHFLCDLVLSQNYI